MFIALPSSVRFVSTGFISPYPLAIKRVFSMELFKAILRSFFHNDFFKNVLINEVYSKITFLINHRIAISLFYQYLLVF